MPPATQYDHAHEIVRKIRTILGDFAGYRALHADGRLYRGVFRANETAKTYTRAPHLQGAEIPVSVRFSKGGGDPTAHFSSTVGMATRFYLPWGGITNLVMLSQKLFIANTLEQFLAFLTAALPPEGSVPDDAPLPHLNRPALQAFFASNPNSGAVFRMRAESPAPVSFAHTEFHSVHAFLYRNANDAVTPARCHWVPTAGVKGQASSAMKDLAVHVLFDELDDRLEHGPVQFRLELELAEPGDPLDDATALWPEDRRRVAIGTLAVTEATRATRFRDSVMNHDPTQLTDGIDPTDDPILAIRRGVYEVSAAQRSGGWMGTAPVSDGVEP